MFASLKNNVFTGIVYNDLSESQKKWHDTVGLTWMHVESQTQEGQEPSKAQLTFHNLKIRDEKIQDISWRIDRYSQQLLALPKTIDSAEWFEKAINYVQQLRDIDDLEGFPFNFEWPEQP